MGCPGPQRLEPSREGAGGGDDNKNKKNPAGAPPSGWGGAPSGAKPSGGFQGAASAAQILGDPPDVMSQAEADALTQMDQIKEQVEQTEAQLASLQQTQHEQASQLKDVATLRAQAGFVQAAADRAAFATFKTSAAYRNILEHTPFELGAHGQALLPQSFLHALEEPCF